MTLHYTREQTARKLATERALGMDETGCLHMEDVLTLHAEVQAQARRIAELEAALPITSVDDPRWLAIRQAHVDAERDAKNCLGISLTSCQCGYLQDRWRSVSCGVADGNHGIKL